MGEKTIGKTLSVMCANIESLEKELAETKKERDNAISERRKLSYDYDKVSTLAKLLKTENEKRLQIAALAHRAVIVKENIKEKFPRSPMTSGDIVEILVAYEELMQGAKIERNPE
jgi:uncharacterized protein (UPF0335 family)